MEKTISPALREASLRASPSGLGALIIRNSNQNQTDSGRKTMNLCTSEPICGSNLWKPTVGYGSLWKAGGGGIVSVFPLFSGLRFARYCQPLPAIRGLGIRQAKVRRCKPLQGFANLCKHFFKNPFLPVPHFHFNASTSLGAYLRQPSPRGTSMSAKPSRIANNLAHRSPSPGGEGRDEGELKTNSVPCLPPFASLCQLWGRDNLPSSINRPFLTLHPAFSSLLTNERHPSQR